MFADDTKVKDWLIHQMVVLFSWGTLTGLEWSSVKANIKFLHVRKSNSMDWDNLRADWLEKKRLSVKDLVFLTDNSTFLNILKKPFHLSMIKTSNKYPREVVEFLSLDIFKNKLEKALGTCCRWPFFEQRIGEDGLQKSLPTQAVFCEIVWKSDQVI